MESNMSRQNKNNVQHNFVRSIIIIIILSDTVFCCRKSYKHHNAHDTPTRRL